MVAFEDFQRPELLSAIPIEIAFLERYGAPLSGLARAAAIARRLHIDPDAALLGEGIVSEEFFYHALADWIGAPYATGPVMLGASTAPDHALVAGIALLASPGAGPRAIVAPRGAALRFLVNAVDRGEPVPPVLISSRQRLSALVRAQFGEPVAREAAGTLGATDASLSASGGLSATQIVVGLTLGVAGVAGAFVAPPLAKLIFSAALWLVFGGAIALRSAAAVAGDPPPASPPLEDSDLPLYTVVVALHREAAVVRKLTQAFDAFDYPGIR